MLTLTESSEYHFAGLVTGPYRSHGCNLTLTFRGDHFDAHLNQDGQMLDFQVKLEEVSDDKALLKSEPFTPPFNSGVANLEMIWTAEMTDDLITGTIEIPTHGFKLPLELKRQ